MSRRLLNGIGFTALAFVVAACSQSSKGDAASSCVVREYQEQGLILDKSWNKIKGRRIGTNFTAFRSNLEPWLIQGFVNRRSLRTLSLEKRAVESFAELDTYTSFLVVVSSQGLKSKNLSKYFEGNYRHINVNELCPIYVGERNGEFALATIRAKQSVLNNENYRQCAIVASLAFFGLPDSELSNYKNYVKPDLLPTMWLYDTEKIRSVLSENTKC